MTIDATAVAAYLRVDEGALVDAEGAITSTLYRARQSYVEPTYNESADDFDADARATWERGIVMAAAALCRRQNTTGAAEGAGGPGNRPRVRVAGLFDGAPGDLLAPFIKIAVG